MSESKRRAGRYPDELHERAVRMVFVHQGESPSQWTAIESISAKLSINHETLRQWVRRTRTDAGQRSGLKTDERVRLRELKREVRELRRVNEMAAAHSLRQRTLDRQSPNDRVIDAHRDRFGVEPISAVLTEHGCKIAPNTYRVARNGLRPSSLERTDRQIWRSLVACPCRGPVALHFATRAATPIPKPPWFHERTNPRNSQPGSSFNSSQNRGHRQPTSCRRHHRAQCRGR